MKLIHRVLVPRAPLEPPRKQWFDKLADALLGDDEFGGPNAATSRYALICQKCFAHNGLVQQNLWEDTRMYYSNSLIHCPPSPVSNMFLLYRIRLPEMWTLQSFNARPQVRPRQISKRLPNFAIPAPAQSPAPLCAHHRRRPAVPRSRFGRRQEALAAYAEYACAAG